ncbi:MAG TPA: Holliday junction branch migration protein RuvA [Bacteroidales bacterium]|nr:Holliday junction branch migration protein RuvA [Bacteroidales bacterium]HQL71422.1 Holliday junction branch migration protein RuvA [Bacteroidales bacterium]
MYEYVRGLLTELNPTYAVVDNHGTGWCVQISLTTFSALKQGLEVQLYLHMIVREDAHTLYGFAEKQERAVFRQLILVNGIGPNTARMILSSLSPDELITAIATNNIGVLKTIKGIGQKSAERMVIELKDKIGNISVDISQNFNASGNSLHDDALQALLMLGFNKSAIDKVLRNILKDGAAASVEQVVKRALKEL